MRPKFDRLLPYAKIAADAIRPSPVEVEHHRDITREHLTRLLDRIGEAGTVPTWVFGDGSSALIVTVTLDRILNFGFDGDNLAKAHSESRHALKKHYNGEDLRQNGLAFALTTLELASRKHPDSPKNALQALQQVLTLLDTPDTGLKALKAILNACL